MQHEGRWNLVRQPSQNGIQMFRALGQYQHFATLIERHLDLVANSRCAVLIGDKVAKHILNSSITGKFNLSEDGMRDHFQIVRCPLGTGRLVPDRPTLHEDDGLLSVAPDGCCRQAQYIFAFGFVLPPLRKNISATAKQAAKQCDFLWLGQE